MGWWAISTPTFKSWVCDSQLPTGVYTCSPLNLCSVARLQWGLAAAGGILYTTCNPTAKHTHTEANFDDPGIKYGKHTTGKMNNMKLIPRVQRAKSTAREGLGLNFLPASIACQVEVSLPAPFTLLPLHPLLTPTLPRGITLGVSCSQLVTATLLASVTTFKPKEV